MKYAYSITRDPFGDLTIKLSDEIRTFNDFVTEIYNDDVSEILDCITSVMDGTYDCFEYSINGISIDIKKEETVAYNPFYEQNDMHCEDTMETDQFRELVLIWQREVLNHPEYGV